MNEEERSNLFETFNAVVISALKEKLESPEWKKKIENTKVKANIILQVGKDEYLGTHIKLETGNFEFNKNRIDNSDLELIAAPEDLMFFSSKQYSTFDMIRQKNQYGYRKLRVKRGLRNLRKLLFISDLLKFD